MEEGRRKKGSRVPERIAGLIRALTGEPPVLDQGEALPEQFAGVRYQLVTATVGTVIEAERRHCRRAVLLVHEFVGDKEAEPDDAGTDLEALLSALAPAKSPIRPGTARGPFRLHGTELVAGEVPLYVAWARTELR